MTPQESQCIAALEKANRVRLERAGVKRELRERTLSMEDALGLECVQGMTLLQLLSAQWQWGRTTVSHACTRLQVSPARRVEELTERQRLLVVAACRSAGGS